MPSSRSWLITATFSPPVPVASICAMSSRRRRTIAPRSRFCALKNTPSTRAQRLSTAESCASSSPSTITAPTGTASIGSSPKSGASSRPPSEPIAAEPSCAKLPRSADLDHPEPCVAAITANGDPSPRVDVIGSSARAESITSGRSESPIFATALRISCRTVRSTICTSRPITRDMPSPSSVNPPPRPITDSSTSSTRASRRSSASAASPPATS